MTPLIDQEIYLLERYSSKEYFGLMRDAFKAMIKTGWAALDDFMRHLPRDYRSKPVYDQPDIVWGGRVLANFSSTAEHLDEVWERLQVGDLSGLVAANGVRNDLIAMGRDYSDDWMPEPFRAEFHAKAMLASLTQEHITSTVNNTWSFGNLHCPTWEEEREKISWDDIWGILPPPPTWPIYRLNPDVRLKTGDTIRQTGIYLPDVDKGSPQFLFACEDEYEAGEVLNGEGAEGQWEPTIWTLVERVADEGGPEPGREPWREDNFPKRVEGGQPCVREGYWWSPADNEQKVCFFKFGEITPIITSDSWGQSYWLWQGDKLEKDRK